MTEFGEREKVQLGCSHTFHYNCILQWNLTSHGENHSSCPLCHKHIGLDENIRHNHILPQSQPQRENSAVTPGDIIENPSYGLSVRCVDCNSGFYSCDSCGIHICQCQFSLDMRDWETRGFHCPANPFENPLMRMSLKKEKFL